MTTRRRFLQNAMLLGSGCLVPAFARAARGAPASRAAKTLSFYHTHTGETLSRVFWTAGKYIPDALADINRLLRDHRNNEMSPIDPQLLTLLERIASSTGAGAVVHVISGYRSPQTNRALADQSDGVARRSLHIDGKAIDIRIPGRDLRDIRNAALALRGGGVGFYERSRFVHIDTGRVRSW